MIKKPLTPAAAAYAKDKLQHMKEETSEIVDYFTKLRDLRMRINKVHNFTEKIGKRFGERIASKLKVKMELLDTNHTDAMAELRRLDPALEGIEFIIEPESGQYVVQHARDPKDVPETPEVELNISSEVSELLKRVGKSRPAA